MKDYIEPFYFVVSEEKTFVRWNEKYPVWKPFFLNEWEWLQGFPSLDFSAREVWRSQNPPYFPKVYLVRTDEQPLIWMWWWFYFRFIYWLGVGDELLASVGAKIGLFDIPREEIPSLRYALDYVKRKYAKTS